MQVKFSKTSSIKSIREYIKFCLTVIGLIDKWFLEHYIAQTNILLLYWFDQAQMFFFFSAKSKYMILFCYKCTYLEKEKDPPANTVLRAWLMKVLTS